MSFIAEDLRFALRSFRKKPGFAFVAVLTLALGIGANTAILGVVNGVLLSPLPFRDPEKLAMIREDNPARGFVGFTASPPNFLDWRSQNRSFEDLAAFDRASEPLTGNGEPEQVRYAETTSSFFSVLGVRPAIGRTYSSGEALGKSRVAVLSDGLWRRRFGARSDVAGSTLRLGGEPYTIIGVMPPGFEYPPPAHELWVPLDFGPDVATQRGAHYVSVIGRLRPRVSLDAATVEMKGIAARLEKAYPESNAGYTVSLKILKDQIVGKVRPALLVLLGAVGLIVLIACANVANLLLARAAGRQREIAVRNALGATRGRIVRQLLSESLLLAAAGTAAALFFAAAADRLIVAFGPADLPRLSEIGIDSRVFLFTLLISAGTVLLFGLFPALHASRPDLAASLKESSPAGSGPGGEKARGMLVAAELALAVLLLSGAGLLVKSFSRLMGVDPGFRPDHVLTFDLGLDAKYATRESEAAFYRTLLDRLHQVPGVDSAASVFVAPLSGDKFSSSFEVEGEAHSTAGAERSLQVHLASPEYFRVMKIPLAAGRLFTPADRRGAPPVVLLTQTAARRFWPAGNALGKKVRLGARPSKDPLEGTVVGIVGDTRDGALDEDPDPSAYFPLDQAVVGGVTVVVRTARAPESVAAAVRNVVRDLDRDLPVVGMSSMEEVVGRSVARPRFYAFLLAVFSGTALLLAAVGIYGVLSYAVASRTREIGVRIAIGAGRRDVLAMVVGRAARLAAVGLAAGVAAALVLTRLLAGILFGVKPFDPPTYAAACAILFLVAVGAALVPAYRASTIDPVRALRDE